MLHERVSGAAVRALAVGVAGAALVSVGPGGASGDVGALHPDTQGVPWHEEFSRTILEDAERDTARLADAAAAGCDLAVITVQPGSRSQHNAQRRGFDLLYTRATLVQGTAATTGT